MKIATLIDIGIAAGREVMAVYEDKAFAAVRKSDGSPVTEADHRAEAVILAALRTEFPGIPVVAEEEVALGRVPPASGSFFLVDPLDGTREFVARNGEFTVNIALIDNGVPVAGMVYAPAIGSIFAGSATGCFRADATTAGAGPLRRVAARRAPERPVATGSRSHCDDATMRWLDNFDIDGFRPHGSSLKFCALACGEADLYPRFGPTMEWDTAAGDAVLRAAGGTTVTLDGVPLVYGKRGRSGATDFVNPAFVATGDRALRMTDGRPVVAEP